MHYGWVTKILTDQDKSFENNLVKELCSLAQVKMLCTTRYWPQTNGTCECFNYTLMSMLGTLPIHTKKNWPEWVSTLTHTYNAMMCHAASFSPIFLMYGRVPILPIDMDFGVALPDLSHASHQNYAEAARPKKYYDQKFKCMKIVPGDLVLVRVKAFGPDHKIANHWEQVPYKVLSQHKGSPVYKVQPINDSGDETIHTLHRSMLFPFQSLPENKTKTQEQNVALVNANLAMMEYCS